MINTSLFLLFFGLIILTETIFVHLFYKKAGFVFFPAIAPMRWLCVFLVGFMYQSWNIGLLVLFFFMASVFWIITNILNNLFVFKLKFYELGQFGIFSKMLTKLFPKNNKPVL